MRPRTIDEVIGQRHVLAEGKLIPRLLKAKEIPSLIFWGPPGSGKTTLAYILARAVEAYFVSFSAVLSGVKDIRAVVAEAESQRKAGGIKTILFVDEIHRFNKAQQDAFLPHVESGLITLIGATTENPSFEIIPPLLSRSRLIVLKTLTEDDLKEVLKQALTDKERGLGDIRVNLSREALEHIISAAQGDARFALNSLEVAVLLASPDEKGVRHIDLNLVEEAIQKKALAYDKDGEEHYNIISAFHKSLRGSDPDAALYWLVRMLAAGEEPLYIARRMIRFASEDVGNADPQALQVAMAALQAYQALGSPEGELALAQAALYLATAPKSNAVYIAFLEGQKDVSRTGSLPVPLHIRNAPTGLMKDLGYGRGYKYAHDFPEALVAQEHLPPEIRGRIYYRPTKRGMEKIIGERLKKWREYLASFQPSTRGDKT
ncbi:MAG: replication-associated recombination protein A [Desulfovibrionales bacterium]|nr:replication-associated recombination protein A [Desulfovibrionales bacterium]